MKKVDYSSAAISRRIRQTEQLRKLSLSLMSAKPITEQRAAELRDQIRKEKKAPQQPPVERPETPEEAQISESQKTELK